MAALFLRSWFFFFVTCSPPHSFLFILSPPLEPSLYQQRTNTQRLSSRIHTRSLSFIKKIILLDIIPNIFIGGIGTFKGRFSQASYVLPCSWVCIHIHLARAHTYHPLLMGVHNLTKSLHMAHGPTFSHANWILGNDKQLRLFAILRFNHTHDFRTLHHNPYVSHYIPAGARPLRRSNSRICLPKPSARVRSALAYVSPAPYHQYQKSNILVKRRKIQPTEQCHSGPTRAYRHTIKYKYRHDHRPRIL